MASYRRIVPSASNMNGVTGFFNVFVHTCCSLLRCQVVLRTSVTSWFSISKHRLITSWISYSSFSIGSQNTQPGALCFRASYGS
eukprot:20401_1